MLEQKSYASASHISYVEYELKANPTKKKILVSTIYRSEGEIITS